MKFRHPTWELVTCLWLAVAVGSQAQTVTTLDWKFSSSANPSFPTTTNPPTVVATATFLSGNYNYLPSGPFGLYGPPTGLWGLAALDATPGVVEFRLTDLVPVTTVNLSLELYHFVDSPSGFYPGEVSFDLPNAQFDGREIVIQQTPPMVGYWVKDTYRWNAVTFLGETINVALSPESSSGTLLIDEAVFTITGSLTPIPEPAVIQLAAAGILLLGICARFRRRQSR